MGDAPGAARLPVPRGHPLRAAGLAPCRVVHGDAAAGAWRLRRLRFPVLRLGLLRGRVVRRQGRRLRRPRRPPGASGARSGPVRTGKLGVKDPAAAGAKAVEAAPRPAGEGIGLDIGDKVTHDSYGLGTVVGLEGAGSSAVAKIDFGGGQVKRLLLRYSPVTKL
ncbi:hypothetical protein [Georgenia sp. SUBG003]|uniref:hypothetical protein n=1 Tax=Georgenia sp. SUBG003 TaxID=1497974 RepID=UPI003AB6E767